MLVLTRRPNQSIMLHDPETDQTYEVHLVEVKGDQVRLGIVAPRSVAVDRSEIAAQKAADRLPRTLTI